MHISKYELFLIDVVMSYCDLQIVLRIVITPEYLQPRMMIQRNTIHIRLKCYQHLLQYNENELGNY